VKPCETVAKGYSDEPDWMLPDSSDDGRVCVAPPPGVELIEEHLREIRCLRQRLEESIRTNDRLRQQLEERLATTGREGGKPHTHTRTHMRTHTHELYIHTHTHMNIYIRLK